MPSHCEFCEKKASRGNQIETRGKAKYLGGVGTKITGITRREFKPNLQRIKITSPTGTNLTVRICTRCLKKGIVRKAVKQAPFKLPIGVKAPEPKTIAGAKKPAAKAAPAKAAPAKPAATKTGGKAAGK